MDINKTMLIMCWVVVATLLACMLPIVIEWCQYHTEAKRVRKYRERMFSNFPIRENVLTPEQQKYLREQLEWCRRGEQPYSPFDVPETLVGIHYDDISEIIEKELLADNDIFLLNSFVGVSIKFFDRTNIWGPANIIESIEDAMEDKQALNKHMMESLDALLTETHFSYGESRTHISWTEDEKYSVWLKIDKNTFYMLVRDSTAKTWAHCLFGLNGQEAYTRNLELIDTAVDYFDLVHALGIVDTLKLTKEG